MEGTLYFKLKLNNWQKKFISCLLFLKRLITVLLGVGKSEIISVSPWNYELAI